MSKFMVSESSLYNGISQQNPALRLDTQVEDAVNTKLTLAFGLEKRPSALLVASEDLSYGYSCKVHPIDIDEDDRYLLVFSDDTGAKDHQAFNIDGTILPVITQDTDVDDYLDTTTPDKDLRLTTVLSTTIITNKKILTSMTGSFSAELDSAKYLWFKNGVQQVSREVDVGGNVWVSAKQTNNDTRALVDSFVVYLGGIAGYTATQVSDSIVKVSKDDLADFTMTATDSYADTTMAIAPVAGSEREDIPPQAVADDIIKIIIDANEEVGYYLKYDEGSSSWFETVGENTQSLLDATLMPHKITIEIDDPAGTVTGTPDQKYFFVQRIDWAPRITGDTDSSPEPSFVGMTINDVFYFKNRLGFLSTESVICSAIDDIFNFWPATVREVLSDDPVDLSVSTTRSVELEFASQFPDSMAIMGSNQQYSLNSGGKPFTSENATLEPTTTYNISDTAKPQSVGSSIFMSVPRDSFSSVREYSVVPDTLVTDAMDITGHVPRLIPDSIKQIIPEPNIQNLFLVDKETFDGTATLWVYAFFREGNKLIQSAWSKWDYWFKPLGGGIFDNRLYLLGTERIDGVDRVVLTSTSLETKAVEVQDYTNTEPLIDRLGLYENTKVTVDGTQARVRIDLDVYNAIDTITNGDFVLVDRKTGFSGDYVSKLEVSGSYFAVFDLQVLDKVDINITPNAVLIGQCKIGGML